MNLCVSTFPLIFGERERERKKVAGLAERKRKEN